MAFLALHHFKNFRSKARGVSTKYLIRHFAEKYGMVYFGAVSQYKDEHQLVRGVTFSPKHRDRHYCAGAIHDHDAILLERTDVLRLPQRKPKTYTWLILQLDLHIPEHALGRLFIEGRRYDETFYESLSVKLRQLQPLGAEYFSGHDPLLPQNFRIYADQKARIDIETFLTPSLTATLAHHFTQYDFEIYSDKVLVYAYNPLLTMALLNDMARAGLWLAGSLDKSQGQ